MTHAFFEKNSLALLIGILIVVSIGGLVEIAPLFLINSTIEKVQGMRPYAPLELAGRNIYIREGCYACHSQMLRTLRDEVERYGPSSLAVESKYDHPMLWGSKRTGPDLARVGGKYSDAWHVDHLKAPREIVPGSVMPGYPFLAKHKLEVGDIAADMKALRLAGVPYTDDMITNAAADLAAQTNPDSKAVKGLLARYPKAQVRKFDGNPDQEQPATELDALISYLQMLGTLVDFTTFDAAGPNLR